MGVEDLRRRGRDAHTVQLGCKLRRRLGRIVGDERVGHAAFIPGLKRLDRCPDRMDGSIGHAIEVRDDAANWEVRTRVMLLQPGIPCMSGVVSNLMAIIGRPRRFVFLAIHHSCAAQLQGALPRI